MTGRLTLSWANKDKALLSHGESGYEWVERDDPRVREVRLLDEVDIVGEAGPFPELVEGVSTESTGGGDNLLIRGDSVDALRALVRTPEYAEKYRGKVKLVYIDPPFNTGQAFEHYDDSLEHSAWLGMMRERLVLIRELLAPDGSVWVHLDDAEMAYCRVLMDEVFGRQNFVATVLWQKTYAPRSSAKHLSVDQDYIVVFARDGATWRPNPMSRTSAQDSKYSSPDGDPREWRPDNSTAPEAFKNQPMLYGIQHPMTGEILYPPFGRRWAYNQERMLDALREWAPYELRQLDDAETRASIAGVEAHKLRHHPPAIMLSTDDESARKSASERLAAGNWPEVYFGSTGTTGIQFKRYMSQGRVPQTLWAFSEVGHTDGARKESQALFPDRNAFATPKPERLLERVIHIGSNPGDIVLDCFAGSGTTAAVAHKMGRRWVTVELSENTTNTFTKPRLTKVVKGEDAGGITKSAGWTGGGGFRDLRVHASVWDVISDELGMAVFQSPDADDATLARSVAAQLGYRQIKHPVFVGAKGRSRLAVASGVVDSVAIADIVSALAEGETAVIAALSHTEDAATTLTEMSRGSRIVRMPSQLFPALGKVTR